MNCPSCSVLSPACPLVTIWMFAKRRPNPLPCLGTAVFHSSEARGGRSSQIVYYGARCLPPE